MKRWFALAATLLLSACAHFGPKPPGDDLPWQQRTPAVAYLRYAPLKDSVVHALRVDLQTPGVQVQLTPQVEAGQTLPNMASVAGTLASVNASFFTKTFTTRGLTVSHGEAWSGISEQQNSPLIACNSQPRCVIQLHAPFELQPGWTEVVAGTPWLLDEGRQRTAIDDGICAYLCAKAHPRTAVGLDASGRWLYLVAAEGRRGPVLGLTLTELSQVMHQLGAHNAVNLDGGGSTTMLLQGESLVARPLNELELRKVANALVIRN
ncbi:phosphodiester glycosidase family protein [Burkholderiaceae bacterium UC74_6]